MIELERMFSLLEPKILATTERWWMLAKPAGWLTIPGRERAKGEAKPVLSSWLETQTQGKAWVVHRIDRETSGLVLFARTAEAHRLANSWFERHQIRKTYEFLAQGNPSLPVFKIDAPIEKARSVTQIEVRERFTSCFLGRAYPVTGRRHQIRIHLAGKNHPLLGDSLYGGPRETSIEGKSLTIARVALHAAKLELPEGESFECPWPEDFQGWLDRIRNTQGAQGS